MSDRRAPYQYIPDTVLDAQRRTDEGAAWARAQRQALGQQWADLHLSDAYDRLSGLLFPQQQESTAPAPQPPTPAAVGPDPLAVGAEGDRPQSEFQSPVDKTLALLDQPAFADKSFTGQPDAVVQQDEPPQSASPDRPPMPMEGLLNVGPMGMRVPTLPPIVPPNVTPPDQSDQSRVLEGRSPIETGDELTGKLTGFLGRQVQSQPGAIAEAVRPDAAGQFEENVARQEARGGYGGGRLGGVVSAVGEAVGGGPGAIPEEAGKAAEVARLRLDKFPEGVRDTIQAAAEDANFWHKQRRGVIPDAQAQQMADNLGRTVDQIIKGGKAGKAYNAETTLAIRNAVVAQSMDVAERARQIAQDPTQATPQMIAEQVAAGLKLADLTRVAEGARAEAGRTLRAYQAFARDYATDPASAVQRIYRATGLTPAQAEEAVAQFTKMTEAGADPFQMADFWAKVEHPPVNAADWFRLVRYNAMLSGPRTTLVNLIGNAAEVPWRLARDTGASIVTGQSGPGPQLQGLGAGAVKGLQGFQEILKHGITTEQAVRGDVPRSLSSRLENPVAKGVATTLEAPGRLMAASDEFFRQLNYGMAKGREAGITASKEGLTGQAWLKRVDELMTNPTPSEGALAVADRMTFHGPMGELGEKVLAPLQHWTPLGVPVGNIVMPFLRTVYHITSRGIDRSPLGAVGTLADAARGVYGDVNPLTRAGRANLGQQLGAMEGPAKGVAPLGERAGDALMGSAAFAGLGLAAAQGNITGKGPSDPEKRKMLQAQGWQPYSVKIGGNYVSYANWGPMAIPLSLAAGLAEGEGTGSKYAYDVFERGANLLTEQSYLQGVGAIFKAMDPNSGATFGERQLEGLLSSLVPFGSAINTVGQATDPVLRQPEKGDIAGAIQARLPGAREALPAQQDVLGRDIANPQQGLGAVSPLRASPERPNSTLQALREAKVDVPDPPKTVSSGDLHNVPITTAEQRRYRTLQGEALTTYVEDYLASDKGKSDSPERRAATLKIYLETARKKAAADILKDIGTDQIRERVRRTKPAA